MNQWGFYFNQDRCLGCKTCIVACKQWNEERRGDAEINKTDYTKGNQIDDKYTVHNGEMDKGSSYVNPETGENNYVEFRKYYMKEMWRKLNKVDSGFVILNEDNSFKTTFERSYTSIACNHCSSPACVEACPVGRIYKESENGLVLINNYVTCLSCGACQKSCPWDAPQFYDEQFPEYAEEGGKPKMTKCTLCKDRISVGKKPACVAACWNRALDAGPMEELKAKYPNAVDKIVGFEPGSKCKPNIIFKEKTNYGK